MRVMVIVKATKASEAGEMPSEQLLRDMGNFNEQLAKSGVMLAGEGLHPTSKAARVRFSGKDSDGHRRPVHRNEGAHCWLLALESEVDAGSDRVGEEVSQSASGANGDRNPSGV